MTFRFQFSAEEDEKLIESLSNYPALYDSGNEHYKNRLMRENMWRQISAGVQRPVTDCRKRWRNIKDTYVKHRRNKLPTDSAAQQKSKWALLAHLSFLDDVSYEQNNPNNINAQNPLIESNGPSDEDVSLDVRYLDDFNDSMQAPEQITTQDEVESFPCTTSKTTSSVSPNVPSKKRKYVDTKIFDMLQQRSSERKKILQSMNHTKCTDTDPLLLFFKSMAMTVKGFEPQLIIEAKSRIFSIVNELEIRSLQSQPQM